MHVFNWMILLSIVLCSTYSYWHITYLMWPGYGMLVVTVCSVGRTTSTVAAIVVATMLFVFLVVVKKRTDGRVLGNNNEVVCSLQRRVIVLHSAIAVEPSIKRRLVVRTFFPFAGNKALDDAPVIYTSYLMIRRWCTHWYIRHILKPERLPMCRIYEQRAIKWYAEIIVEAIPVFRYNERVLQEVYENLYMNRTGGH